MSIKNNYLFLKERIFYILYLYPYSCFNINIIYKLFKQKYGFIASNVFYDVFYELEKLKFVERVENDKEVLKKNGIKIHFNKPSKRRKRIRYRWILTKKAEEILQKYLEDDEMKEILKGGEEDGDRKGDKTYNKRVL